MNDEVKNFNRPTPPAPGQPNFDPNRPRFKKIKRPVQRNNPAVAGGVGVAPLPPRAQNFESNKSQEEQSIKEVVDFNLDSLLDDELHLPATTPNGRSFNQQKPEFMNEEELGEADTKMPLIVNGMFSKKAVAIVSLAVFLAGFLFGKMLFSSETVVRDGLQGVVINSEVPRGRARCGVAEPTMGCVLYIMNPQRRELNARDFYDLASQLTGRQRFLIETANMRYASVKIKPGEIAQLSVPPLQ